MSTNQKALIRYQVLDACFSNYNKKYFIDDLIKACEDAIERQFGTRSGCSKRQVQEDMNYMKREDAYNAPIESIKEGRRTYYRYEDEKYSIKSSKLSPVHLQQIKEALSLLSGIRGIPGLDWASTALVKLNEGFAADDKRSNIISFEENMYLTGIGYLEEIYQSIHYFKVLEITYKPFKSTAPKVEIVSPHYLKQYNNRWFLFGFNHKEQKIQNLALDRITKIHNITSEIYCKTTIDYEEYFEDIVGVSQQEGQEIEKVVLKVAEKQIPYLKSKPLHGSQKLDEATGILRLELKLNYELESILLSFGEYIEVIEPKSLAIKIEKRIKSMIDLYQCSDSA